MTQKKRRSLGYCHSPSLSNSGPRTKKVSNPWRSRNRTANRLELDEENELKGGSGSEMSERSGEIYYPAAHGNISMGFDVRAIDHAKNRPPIRTRIDNADRASRLGRYNKPRKGGSDIYGE